MSESKFPVRTLLFISLAVNLLIVGAAVGVVASGARLHRQVAPPAMGPRAFMRAVPPEQERAVRDKLAKTWSETGDERQAVREARLALAAELDKPTFDEAAVRAALAKMRAADTALAARNQDAVVAVLKDMKPEERRAAIGALLRAGSARRGMGPAMGQEPPPPGDVAPDDRRRPGERLREWRERRRERAMELENEQDAAPPP